MTTSPYFGQKDVTIPSANPYVSAAPVAGYANNPVVLNQYYQAYNESIPVSKTKYGVRRMLKWLVPERGVVEMYINPQSIQISKKKAIIPTRTKGGFIVQYWGEELTEITVSGHTGTSGIEGINVLDDIYRGEQIAFDIVALEEASKLKQEEDDYINIALPGLSDVTDFLDGLEQAPVGKIIEIPLPTLGYYATSVEMYWMGEVYRGYFTSFNVRENAEKLGLFDYDLSFTSTQKRGFRRNYLPWHKTPLAGPSDHNTIPFTYDAKSIPSNSQFSSQILLDTVNSVI